LCQKTLFLKNGKIVKYGPTNIVIEEYLKENYDLVNNLASISLKDRKDRKGNGSIYITSIQIKSCYGSSLIYCNDCLEFELTYEASRSFQDLSFMVGIYGSSYQPLYRLDSKDAGGIYGSLPLQGKLVCTTTPINLAPGLYWVNVAIMMGNCVLDHVEQASSFYVEPMDFYCTGKLPPSNEVPCLLPQKWKIYDFTMSSV
ncbi:MAG: Wzt carbohydrate-binding domain-containing protein, partial [Candidatus Calescibacterium sp.]|nr:Wzt carbohydrate-binding domain-containing protein [Candidatus Calescibacterium sp.]